MRNADIKRLRSLYPRLWSPNLGTLPNGWAEIAEELLEALNEIQPPIPGEYGSPLYLMIQHGGGFAIAMVSPNPELGHWTPKKGLDVIQAVARFNHQICETCEVLRGAVLHRRERAERSQSTATVRVLCSAAVGEV